MRCAALDWDKSKKDYVECSPTGETRVVRILGIVSVEVELCEIHRRIFEEELAIFDGCLSRKSRVIEVRI